MLSPLTKRSLLILGLMACVCAAFLPELLASGRSVAENAPLAQASAGTGHVAVGGTSRAPRAHETDASADAPAMPRLGPARLSRSAESAESTRPAQPASSDRSAARTERGTDGIRYRVRRIRLRVTAYCPCKKCCGKHADGVTASGKSIFAHNSKFVAADTDWLPIGGWVSVPGYNNGKPVPVLDRGSAIKGKKLDLFYLNHHTAREWGVQWLTVTVYEPVGRAR